jgi:hypothetical protein
MMTPQEFEYIRRAMEAIESPDCTPIAKIKIQRTMSQILGRSADKMEQAVVDRVDQNMANNYLLEKLRHASP